MDSNSESPGPGPGFLGSTSFSAVFNEDQSINGPQSRFCEESVISSVVETPTYREGRVELGAQVLRHLSRMDLFETVITEWQEDDHGLTQFCPWIMKCMKSIKEDLYDQIPWHTTSHQDQDTVLLRLSEGLFRNNLKPMRFDGDCTLDHFATLFTGSRLRWESIGMFFICVAVGSATMKRGHPILSSFVGSGPQSQAAMARRMLDLTHSCIKFCEEMGHLTGK